VRDTPLTLFADAELERAVRASLGMLEGQVSDEDLARLTELHGLSTRVVDLTGIERCRSLRVLRLAGDDLSDLTPLASLTNLEVVYLSRDLHALWRNHPEHGPADPHRNITDLTPLAGLHALRELRLNRCRVSDIGPIAGLTNLEVLELGYNPLGSLTPLAGLSRLRELRIATDPATDLTPLASLTALVELRLIGRDLDDISALAGLAKLEILSVRVSSVADISSLGGLANLRVLSFLKGAIQDLGPLASLTRLETVELRANEVADIGPLLTCAEAGALRYVDLGCNPLGDVALSAQVPALEALGVTVFLRDEQDKNRLCHEDEEDAP